MNARSNLVLCGEHHDVVKLASTIQVWLMTQSSDDSSTEKLDYVAMTILRSEIESGVTVTIAERDICSMIQQSLYDL